MDYLHIFLVYLNDYWQSASVLAGIFISLLIYWRQSIILKDQNEQLVQLRKIGSETADTAQKLRTETATRRIVNKFFSIQPERREPLKCVFPVYYNRRPLPFILAGDSYALYVLQNVIGSERLDLKMLEKEMNPEDVPKDCVEGDAIYLCSPQANPALKKLAPSVKISTPLNQTVQPRFGELDLPCWFADDVEVTNGESREIKRIWLHENKDYISSPAEKDYQEALQLEGKAYTPPPGSIQTDHAIILRITEPKGKIIVVAGIHQYGTWIGGDFLRRLAEGEKFIRKEVFLSEDDFMAIIWGNFDSNSVRVVRCGVLHDFVWVRREGTWEQVPGLSARSGRG